MIGKLGDWRPRFSYSLTKSLITAPSVPTERKRCRNYTRKPKFPINDLRKYLKEEHNYSNVELKLVTDSNLENHAVSTRKNMLDEWDKTYEED